MDKISLLAALAAAVTTVPVEGFGDVRLRQLSVVESDKARAEAQKQDAEPSEFGLRLLVASVINVDGSPFFTEEDLPALRESAGTKIDSLVAKVLEHNGLSKGKN